MQPKSVIFTLRACKPQKVRSYYEIIIRNTMDNKVLKVTKPFAWMEVGDTLKLSEDGYNYTNTFVDEYSSLTEKGDDISSKVETTVSFSREKADELMKSGYLAPNEPESHVNVFGEIDAMISTYTDDLANLEEDMKNAPACIKLEKETVLRNLIKALNYLKSLKH